MNEREVLFKHIQVCDFVLQETALFLDSHPEDKAALAYYNKHNEMRKKYMADYVGKYGPIERGDAGKKDRWDWIDGPWPWQNEED